MSFSPVISFDEITKKFPIRKGFKVQYVHAVRNVSLDIYQGEIMAVKHLFLAILSKQAMHGYELKSAFENILSEQWQLNYGQVYTTLARLERDGLVTAEEVHQEEKPDKRIYRLTEEGYKLLNQWLEQSTEWNVFGDELSFQLVALEYIDRTRAEVLLKEYRVHLLALMNELVAKKTAIGDTDSLTFWIYERNIMKAEAELKWIEFYIRNRKHI